MADIQVGLKPALTEVKNITVEWNGNYYNVIYGKHENGGFYSIPNWNAGGELSSWYDDVFWNTESISKSLKSKMAAKAIAEAIAYADKKEKEQS